MSTDVALRDLGLSTDARDEPGVLLGLRPRLRSWLWHHRVSIVSLTPLLAAVTVVAGAGLGRAPAPFDDEGTYVAQAWAVGAHHQLAHYTYWYDHPPLGWIQLAIGEWLLGPLFRSAHAIVVGRELVLVAHVVSAGLLYVLARRLGCRRGFALLAVALFGFSPLVVEWQRMVLLDNIALPWLLAAFVLAATPRRSLWAAAGAGLCLAVSVLTKETFLLLAPAVLWQLVRNSDRKTRSFCVTAFLTTATLCLVAYPLYALLKGELFPGASHVSLLDAVHFQLVGRASSGNVLSPSSVAHRTVMEWFHQDPWFVVMSIAATAAAAWVPRLRPVALAMVIQLVMILRPGYLPIGYVVAALPFGALLAAGALDALASRDFGRRVRRPGLRLGLVSSVVIVALVVSIVAPRWERGLHSLNTDVSRSTWAAEQWIATNVPRDSRLIVDDTMWLDLVHDGFDSRESVVWFFKLDTTNNLDPSVMRMFPGGWRDFQYVVVTPSVRQSLADMGGLTPVRDAVANSTPVASFGTGDQYIEIRKIAVAPR